MPKYFNPSILASLLQDAKTIVGIRNKTLKDINIDILDTDAISSLYLYEIISQYDPNYNINFARNGEDAKSEDVLIEQKSTRVNGALTKTGKPRKGAGSDACFQFHAMGDLDYPRYIFAAKNKDDLAIERIYDISSIDNRTIILNYLLAERNAWLDRSYLDKKQMKRDIIILPEKFILDKLTLSNRYKINNCVILKD